MFLTISQDSTFHGNGQGPDGQSWGPTPDRVTFSGFFGKQLGFKLKYLAPHQHNKGLNCLITDIMIFWTTDECSLFKFKQ